MTIPVHVRAAASSAVVLLTCILNGCGGAELVTSTHPPPVPALAIISTMPPSGDVGAAYGTGGTGFQLSASGGKTPYAWSWVAGNGSSLPAGLEIVNGSIVGTPTIAGDYSVVVSVIDSESPTIQTSTAYTIAVTSPAPRPIITSVPPPNGIVGVNYGLTVLYTCVASPVLGWHQYCAPCKSNCSSLPRCHGFFPSPCGKLTLIAFTFTAAGGTGPYTWAASGLPTDLTLDSQTGRITGTPSVSGNYSINVKVHDSESPPLSAAATYNITIN